MKWDSINHWLHIGRVTLMFGDWFGWFASNNIREFNFFTITWDTGAWWGFETEENKDTPEHMIREGDVTHFFQIVILGIGVRVEWKRKTTVVMPRFWLRGEKK